MMPKNIAVTGSSAPRIAVGVEPMLWIAAVVHRKDIAVGNTARPSTLPHIYQCDGIVICPIHSSLIMNTESPNTRT